MTSALADAVEAQIRESRDDLLETASRLVETPSVTGDEGRVQDVVETMLGREFGLEVDRWQPDPAALADHPGFFETSSFTEVGYDGRDNVVAAVPGRGDGRSLAFSGHVDVVSPEPSEAWTRGPWAPWTEDGRLYGRGAADMKGGIAAFLHTYRALADLGVDLAGDLVLQTTIEEEDGGAGGMLSALERGYVPDAMLVPEAWAMPNVGVASAGVLYFRVTVEGEAAHAARAYRGVNAITKLQRVLAALDDLDAARKRRISYEPAVRRDPAAAGNVTNLNVGTVHAGDWPSSVPQTATAECRIGWPPGESRAEVQAQVEAAVKATADRDDWLATHQPTVEWFGWQADPHELSVEDPFVRLVEGHVEAVTGDPARFIGGDSGLDERFPNQYYDVPTPTVGPTGGNVHGVDEWVDVDSLLDTAVLYAHTAIDWCGVADDGGVGA
jgi:acetylornithine deacetylase